MSKPLVIAHIVQHLAPGGIETMAIELQRNVLRDTSVYIISLQGERGQSIKAWKKLAPLKNIHFLEKSDGFSVKAILHLIQILNRLDVDIVHTHHAGPLIYGGLSAKLSGRKHVHTEHDAWYLNSRRQRFLVSSFYRLLKPTTVAVSKLVAATVASLAKCKKPTVVFNGVDTEIFAPGNQTSARQQIGLPVGHLIIGCAARLTAVKNHAALLTTLAELPKSVHLALAGYGECEQSLIKLSQSMSLESRVHFLGNVENMPAFYNSIDIFCLNSSFEGLPCSLLEAQACEKLVVTTNVGSCQEGTDNSSGLVIEPDNHSALVAALSHQIECISSNKTATSARAFIKDNFDINKMVNEYHRIYQEAA